jgi:hypothetical protein
MQRTYYRAKIGILKLKNELPVSSKQREIRNQKRDLLQSRSKALKADFYNPARVHFLSAKRDRLRAKGAKICSRPLERGGAY